MQTELNAVVAAFNRGSLDVPAGWLTGNTTYCLNGTPYESLLGGSPDDPLIRMLARGVAGYRTAAKALQFALQNPTATIEDVTDMNAQDTCSVRLKLDGRLRDTDTPFSCACELQLRSSNGQVVSANAICPPEALTRIAQARRS